MVKHTQTIRRLFPTNSLSVFDHFVELALKRLNCIVMLIHEKYQRCFHNSVKHLRWHVFAKIVKSSTPLTLLARSSILSIWQGYRSSRPEVLCKNGVLRNFAKFTGKLLRQSLFLIKLQASGVSLWILRNF